MPADSVRIRLEDRACALALQPRRAGAPAMDPSARRVIERGIPGPPGSHARIVTCTLGEARALLDHFSGLTDTLSGLVDPDAPVCAAARDTVRRAVIAAEK